MNASHKIESEYTFGAREFMRRLGLHPRVHPESVEIGKIEWDSTPWTKRGGRYVIKVKTTRWA